MKTNVMPPISLNNIIDKISKDEFFIVQEIVRNGHLKSTRPAIKYEYINKGPVRIKRPTEFTGRVAYLWSAVAYHVSPYTKDLACPPDYRQYINDPGKAERLDKIAEMIYDNIPIEYHYGLVARGIR